MATFSAVGINTVFVIGHDAKLWLEYGPFDADHVPPWRKQVCEDAFRCSGFNLDPHRYLYVIDIDRNLWRYGYGNSWFAYPGPAWRNIVDVSTAPYLGAPYIVDGDGLLFFLGLPVAVDDNTMACSAVDDSTVYKVDRDGGLYLEFPAQGFWGDAPLQRRPIRGGVRSCSAVNDHQVFVVDDKNRLFFVYGDFRNLGAPGVVPESVLIDTNVLSCSAVPGDALHVYVNGLNNKLWLAQADRSSATWGGAIPPARDLVDRTVHGLAPTVPPSQRRPGLSSSAAGTQARTSRIPPDALAQRLWPQ